MLLLLIGVGLVLVKPGMERFEYFANPPANPVVSPALANILASNPNIVNSIGQKIDALSRDTVIQQATAQQPPACPKCPSCPSCPTCPAQRKCPTCPDMSQYVKLNEVPCWNCSLP